MDDTRKKHRRTQPRNLPAPASGSSGRKRKRQHFPRALPQPASGVTIDEVKKSSARRKRSGIAANTAPTRAHKTGVFWLAPVFLLIATVAVLCVACLPYVDMAVSAFKVYLNDSSTEIAPAEAGKYPAFGTEFATVQIPSINLIYPVMQGDTEALLSQGVCHFYGSDLPGENSSILFTAHRTTHFSGIGALKPGDSVTVDTSWGTYEYAVDEAMILYPADIAGLLNASQETLYLITCYPFNFIGGAPQRYAVRCHLVSGPPHSLGEEAAARE